MKRYIFLVIMILVSLVILTKLVRISKPIVVTDQSNSESSGINQKRYRESGASNKTSTETFYHENPITNRIKENSDLNIQKLNKYAQAYVTVQRYMERVGSSANYNDTTKIVKSYGLSVEDYTLISTQMNTNPQFREKVQKLILKIQRTHE